jgi:proteasome accessory factor C
MAQAPKFVERVARIPAALALLSSYPDGLSLRDLADHFGVDPETIRQDLSVYYDTESWGWSFDIFRRSVIEFSQPVGTDEPQSPEHTIVRVVSSDPAGLGVEHVSSGDLAVLYTAGLALLDIDPDEVDLAEALERVSETMLGQPATVDATAADWNRHLGLFEDAISNRTKVRITYSRAWRKGVFERDIEPLKLVQTRRSWEVDAGPVEKGTLRTYLLSNVRAATALDETFETPSGVDQLLHKQRETTTVRVRIAQDARWAARLFSEELYVVAEDEEWLEADLEMLPPAGERVGLIMLASGPETRLMEPTRLLPEAVGLARELLQHHSQ